MSANLNVLNSILTITSNKIRVSHLSSDR